MEKIINYKFYEFLQIEDVELIEKYIIILDMLNPLSQIKNPKYNKFKFWQKEPKEIEVKSLLNLSFGDVTTVRNNFYQPTIENIIESIEMVTGVEKKEIIKFTILEVYGIINKIKEDLETIQNMELNELSSEEDDIDLITVNANGRMAKFGVLNTIDAIAKGDLTKWNEVEKLPYLTVFTKLMMDKEKNAIEKEIADNQRKKLKT